MVQDLDRPDVNGVLPKMNTIGAATEVLMKELLPYVKVKTDDNLCSSVMIRGSLQPREQWTNGIFENSTCFNARIAPKARYYKEGDSVVLEVFSSHGMKKFRKYTGTPEKALVKLATWIKEH